MPAKSGKSVDPESGTSQTRNIMERLMKFLIVDDSAVTRFALESMLENQQHEVDVAVHGLEALEKARRTPPDMIISDVLMPQMDGFTFCKEIKQDANLHGIPLVFYTVNYLQPAHKKLALALGASAYIEKPAQPLEFLKAIEGIISQYRKHKLKVPIAPVGDNARLGRLHEDMLVQKLGEEIIELEREIADRKRTEEALKERIDEIERMNRLMVGRELKMGELSKEVKALKQEITMLRSKQEPI